jgi:predicted cation transporter
MKSKKLCIRWYEKMILELLLICVLVLVLPLTFRFVEENLELFLFAMGLLASVISGALTSSLFIQSTIDPIMISIAVLISGVLLKWFQVQIENIITIVCRKLSIRIFVGLAVIVLGLLSSVITAIIAALVLVVIVNTLYLNRQSEILFVVLSCFSIGLGAALTPIGEPLSTIAINKLAQDFFFLLRLLGLEIGVAIVIYGLLAAVFINPQVKRKQKRKDTHSESYDDIINRTIKIYFFVMGLSLLGASFEPLINKYFLGLDSTFLYWVNMISMILDNATLAAAEISPEMDLPTVRAILLGLLISGGMLIPGNIPNIIAASKLKISSKEWAKFGFPIGLLMMIIYYLIILWL